MNGLRILLVEDHDESRVALDRLLRLSGHETFPAATAREARMVAAIEDLDLLLIDLLLPDASGVDLLRDLRAHTAAPAIAMSGLAEEGIERACDEADFRGHVRKPVVFDDLQLALESAWRGLAPVNASACRPMVRPVG